MNDQPIRQPREIIPIVMDDGCRSAVTRYPGDRNGPVFIILPAMGVPADYYKPLADTVAQLGSGAVTADLRGHGYSSLRASRKVDFGYHDMIAHDLPAAVAATREHFPGTPIFLLGHSLGGQLGVLYASRFPGHVAGIVLVASCSVYFRGWPFPANLALLLGTQLAWVVAGLLGYFPGRALGFGGREARTTIRDWARNARTGTYSGAGAMRGLEVAMAQMTTPVLAISLYGDRFAPPRAVRCLGDKLKRAPVDYLHLGDAQMPAAGRDHFKWVFHSAPIVRVIQAWLAKTQNGWRN